MARLRSWLLKQARSYPNTIPGALLSVVSVILFYTAVAWGIVWVLTRPWMPWLPHARQVPPAWSLGWHLFMAAGLLSFLWRRRRARISPL